MRKGPSCETHSSGIFTVESPFAGYRLTQVGAFRRRDKPNPVANTPGLTLKADHPEFVEAVSLLVFPQLHFKCHNVSPSRMQNQSGTIREGPAVLLFLTMGQKTVNIGSSLNTLFTLPSIVTFPFLPLGKPEGSPLPGPQDHAGHWVQRDPSAAELHQGPCLFSTLLGSQPLFDHWLFPTPAAHWNQLGSLNAREAWVPPPGILT